MLLQIYSNTFISFSIKVILFAIILIAGMLLAVISTYRAISKYLKMSLDDLY